MTRSKNITNPFPGLRPFESDEYRLFFGREGQSDALISRLQRSRFLAVVGTSGSGKSSLVRAGLLPALRGGMMAGAGSGWRIAIMRPGSDPIGNLALALAKEEVLLQAGGGLPQVEVEAVIEASLRRGSLGMVEVARQARLAEPEKLLVVVDQFEELFRFRAARESSSNSDDASAFVKLLLEASQQREFSIYVVPTMRSDFLGDCAQFQGLPEAINDGQYLIPRMTRDERRFAITGPVGVTRGKITEPLVNRLMNDVGDNPDQLPILQHALMRTWDRWSTNRRNGEPIGLEHYEAVGTMSEALSRHANEAWEELDPRGQLVAELLFKALTERGADNREIRRPTSLQDICAITNTTAAEVVAVIDVFRGAGRSFLMPPAGVALKPETVIDISHESLIRNWDRLRAWVDDEAQSARIYRRLAEAAKDYYRKAGGLLDDVTLQYVLSWRDRSKPGWAWGVRYHPDFNTAIAYLELSTLSRDARIEAEQERERRELETTRALAEAERQRNEERTAAQQRELETTRALADAERQRNEDRAAAQQRELEHTRDFAEKQSRAAQRLRRFAFALVLISLLALGAAGTAAFAYNSARKSKNAAQLSEKSALEEKQKAVQQQEKAEAATLALQKSKTELESTTRELQTSVNEFKTSEKGRLEQTALAKRHAVEAQASEKKAQSEAANALKREREAVVAQTQADAARKLAEDNAERAGFLRHGLEARQSGDYDLARMSFESLIGSLNTTLAPSNNQLEKDIERQLTVDLGWAHSNLGGVWLLESGPASARLSYEAARRILEQVWPKDRRAESEPDAVLFQTYNGLGHAYQTIALEGYDVRDGHQEKIEPQPYFKKAEALFLEALDYYKVRYAEDQMQLKVVAERGVAQGYADLAHLYRDMGVPDKVEQNLENLVALDRGGEEQIAARRELADFYRTQNKTEKAVAAYNKLIDEQEKFDGNFEEGYAKLGPEIANSYGELADVYRAKVQDYKAANTNSAEALKNANGDYEKANEAFELSTVMQRFSTRLRRSTAPGSGSRDDRDDLADSVADAYVKVGKFDRALVLYDYALKIRASGGVEERASLGKSYDRLAKFYRAQKDYSHAAEYYENLIEFYRVNPRRGDYVAAMLSLASLKAEDPNASPEAAVSIYESAATIAEKRRDWSTENIVHFRLAKLYEKRNQPTEQALALGKRVSALEKYIDELVAHKPMDANQAGKLVSEYLQAVNVLAYFHTGKNNDKAADAYQLAFNARGYITDNIHDETLLKFYAALLADYQTLLTRIDRKPLAADVGRVAQGLRETLTKAEGKKLTTDSRAASAQSAQ